MVQYGMVQYGLVQAIVWCDTMVWCMAMQWYGVMVQWSNGRQMVQHGVRQDGIGQSPELSNLARFQN